MAAASIMNLLFLFISVERSISGSSPLNGCKILFIYSILHLIFV